MEGKTQKRGFDVKEYERRLSKAQSVMHQKQLDFILLSTEANILYFTGFLTQFWKSPTRPWFVLVPREGKPVAVIPRVGESGMRATWVDEIYTWDSPNPEDEGVSAVVETIKSRPAKYHRIGVPLGQESKLGMPLHDFYAIQAGLGAFEFVDVALDIHQIRVIKSDAEVEKIKMACDSAIQGFDLLPTHATVGQTERQICRQMNIDMLQAGADQIEYLICGSGQDGYDSIIMGPIDKPLSEGDIMVIDTGATFDGYFTDFCRNYSFGPPSEQAKQANAVIYNSITAAFKIARPGKTTSDLFNAMWEVLEAGGALGNGVGRLGHGLGCELTEWPSNTADDKTVLAPGMVITLEPGMEYAPGKSMVHEENILITEDEPVWLTRRAAPDLIVLD